MKKFGVGPSQESKKLYKVYKNDLKNYNPNNDKSVYEYIDKSFKSLINGYNHKFLLLSYTGTSLMEVALLNTFNKNDKILVINGGDFGNRFVEILKALNLNYTELKLNRFTNLTKEELYKYDNIGFTALLINMCETSTGILYDLDMISEFVKKNNLIFVVDAISSFLSDHIDLEKYNIDEIFITSQKGLALSCGLSILGLSNKASNLIMNNKVNSFSFDLKKNIIAYKNYTCPFTPAVSIILELYRRLKEINKYGYDYYVNLAKNKMDLFKNGLRKNNIEFLEESSNSITIFKYENAIELYNFLISKNQLICKPRVGFENYLRVSSYGYHTLKDYDTLLKYIVSFRKKQFK